MPSRHHGPAVFIGVSVFCLLAASQHVRAEILLDTMSRRGARLVADVAGGGAAELTLSPALQHAAEEELAAYEVPFGAVAAISIPDGRVLALAGRSTVDPTLGPEELALRP